METPARHGLPALSIRRLTCVVRSLVAGSQFHLTTYLGVAGPFSSHAVSLLLPASGKDLSIHGGTCVRPSHIHIQLNHELIISPVIARFFLGFGIGPKSATVPIYAAETTPPAIRGALVMQWQVWTAFGIMLGNAADLCFYKVADRPNITGLNWRLMMSSAMLPALVVIAFVFMCPESPRWYMSKGRHYKAYQSMSRLRFKKVQAARDVFYMHTLLDAENLINVKGKSQVLELFTIPRNRRALIGSEIGE